MISGGICVVRVDASCESLLRELERSVLQVGFRCQQVSRQQQVENTHQFNKHTLRLTTGITVCSCLYLKQILDYVFDLVCQGR